MENSTRFSAPRPPVCRLAAASLAILLTASLAAAGSDAPDCRWSPVLVPAGFDGALWTVTSRVEGDSIAIYAGGSFRTIDGVEVNHVARWDGRNWRPLVGPDGVGTDGPVRGLVFFDDGSGAALYAIGPFGRAGGRQVNRVARWDGHTWTPLAGPDGVGLTFEAGVIESPALTVWNDGTGPALYAAGRFDRAGGVYVNGIARWDGKSWSPVGDPSGPKERFYSLFGSQSPFGLFAGCNEGPVKRWDGSSWSTLPIAGDRPLTTSMVAWNPGDGTGRRLYAAGRVDEQSSLLRWDGDAWTEIPTVAEGVRNHQIHALAVFDGDLFATGSFSGIGDANSARGMARWDGSTWHAVDGSPGGLARPITGLSLGTTPGQGPVLLAGGIFEKAGGSWTPTLGVWDGGAWTPLESPGAPDGVGSDGGGVITLETWDDGTGDALYLGGYFQSIGNRPFHNIARTDGHSFSPLAGPDRAGTPDGVLDLATWSGGGASALYALSDSVYRWDGGLWTQLDPPDGSLSSMVAWQHPESTGLYVGGTFSSPSGPDAAIGLARWDGETWHVDDVPADQVYPVWIVDLATSGDGPDSVLYALGDFVDPALPPSQPPESRIGRWDGESWALLAEPLPPDLFFSEIEVVDLGNGPTLYAGTYFSVLRWSGDEWIRLRGGPDSLDGRVVALAAWNDGSGPVLVASQGELRGPQGIVERDYRALIWDGVQWRQLGNQKAADRTIDTLLAWDDGTGPSLYAGGFFSTIDGVPSAGLAEWSCGSACDGDSEHTLCLGQDRRFEVEIDWRDFGGDRGRGKVVPLSSRDSGLFYFFGEDNWELLVKLLDGCAINDHHWVFAAATTNVEYALRVTDTLTGEYRTYENPLGVASPAITDTGAFAGCP